MKQRVFNVSNTPTDALVAARCIADQAVLDGIFEAPLKVRPVCDHMGAVLADVVLQAGLNYSYVVRPRVDAILADFPHAKTICVLVEVIQSEGSPVFLRWSHPEKLRRFEGLLDFLQKLGVLSVSELSCALMKAEFRANLQKLRGIGPKTVDYMSCLVGADCIAVDRHIKGFASTAGVKRMEYSFLKDVFEYAADLLSIPRREFDFWIWQFQTRAFST